MSSGNIELIGDEILCSVAAGGREARYQAADALGPLRGWAKRYDDALRTDHEGELAAIGAEMFAWLNKTGWASAWANGAGDRTLEIVVPGDKRAAETALLDAPWELLSRETGPLAGDDIQLFVVARRIGRREAPRAPDFADLQAMFMAAAPQGQSTLDYEGEETAILKATQRLPMRLIVEESGALEFLGPRLASSEGPFEALHLSCHGDIDDGQPVLLLEDAAGGGEKATPGALRRALGAEPIPLVVLSACRTAEHGARAGGPRFPGQREAASELGFDATRRDAGAADPGAALATPFAQDLVRFVPNVVGWDGSVYDVDATLFAASFYEALAKGASVPQAAASGRLALLQQKARTPQRGRHWHLARVYLGPKGGGPLCGGKARRNFTAPRMDKAYLDKERQRIPVATREEFVGRRRSIQQVIRAFRDGRTAILIHGMGALGKSSLAARVINRMISSIRPVVVFERYDALAIFDAIVEMLPAEARTSARATWREQVKADPGALADALQDWLEGPLNDKPILLIIDDLERILETPDKSSAVTGVQEASRPALAATLAAFERAATQSRLLLTSRYDFRAFDNRGVDIAESLMRIALTPMQPRERIKQWRAAERVAGQESEELSTDGKNLLDRALEAAAGNPGLQAILTMPILSHEFDAARQALDAIDVYRTTGAPPEEIQKLIDSGAAKDSENALTRFFARLSLSTYRDALTADQARQLTAATLFDPDVPIPLAALKAAGSALGVEAPDAAITRLLGLGLLDDWGQLGKAPHAAVNPLARPLAAALEETDRPRLCRKAWPELVVTWRDARGNFPVDARGLAAARIALSAKAEPALLEPAVFAGAAWLERVEERTREALEIIRAAFAASSPDHALRADFLRLGVECADRLGDAAFIEALLAAAVRASTSDDIDAVLSRADLDLRHAERLIQTGEMERAEVQTRQSLATYQKLAGETLAPDEIERAQRMAAIAQGQIAGILYRRGELDEALRIRKEEEIPVYERLGDVHSRAVTMGQIADILVSRGDLNEALRIHKEEQLPVYERLGDVREGAVTIGKIADILYQRGEFDEALRIRKEEEIPVYERLGDVRSLAVTMGQIADILYRRGELDEALRIRKEEQLPVYQRLGDVRGRAVTMGKIADILASRGDLDEALRIRKEEELPVYERLGDVRSLAVTMGKIADILYRRGELDEALRIRKEEQLPVYERLGDVRERSTTLHRIAITLLRSGDLDGSRIKEILEALAEAFMIAKELQLADGIAFVGGDLAQVLAVGENFDEAFSVLDDAEAAFVKLKDTRGLQHVADLRRSIQERKNKT